ncbi:MAG: GNAT family N-acetyltransferase [Bacteroidales bacterium]|nr:GNAT family N-acetyltransferase [Bacteroidales bacterium]
MNLIDTTAAPTNFFDILAQDWREDIESIWHKYAQSAKIYLLNDEKDTLGGGIVFSTVSPDMEYAKDEAQAWFDKGYLYLGFIWIAENRRSEGLGSIWLKKIYEQYPSTKFWLTIEDLDLIHFYKKNGFRFEKKLINNNNEEWLLVYDSEV